MAKGRGNVIGGWAFLVGVILAIILGLGFGQNFAWLLVVIGLIIGLLNIADEEASQFLMSGTILVVVSALGGEVLSELAYVGGILPALVTLFVPATIVVAIRHVFSLAKH
ncbi:MAG: hypothetical protein RL557_977 [archaeon]|jgi:hypothetical protein